MGANSYATDTPQVDACLIKPMEFGPDEESERFRNLIDLARKLERERWEAIKSSLDWWAAASPYSTPGALREALKQSHGPICSQWIAVSERLPEATVGAQGQPPIISADVLLYWPGALECNYDIGNYDHQEGTWHLINSGYEQPDIEPTHWQPLESPRDATSLSLKEGGA